MNLSEELSKRPIGDVNLKDIEETTQFLNNLLANEYVLFTKNLNYHWNVTGQRFHSLHLFLEEGYKSLLPMMDSIAERVRVLGESPISTLNEIKSSSDVSESNSRKLSSSEMIQDLFSSNLLIQESIKSFLSENNNFKVDFGTEDFLISILQKHEETSWKLKSHLD